MLGFMRNTFTLKGASTCLRLGLSSEEDIEFQTSAVQNGVLKGIFLCFRFLFLLSLPNGYASRGLYYLSGGGRHGVML